MIYVLILVSTISFRGVSVTTQEFSSEQACIEAGKAAEKLNSNATTGWTCKPKGSFR